MCVRFLSAGPAPTWLPAHEKARCTHLGHRWRQLERRYRDVLRGGGNYGIQLRCCRRASHGQHRRCVRKAVTLTSAEVWNHPQPRAQSFRVLAESRSELILVLLQFVLGWVVVEQCMRNSNSNRRAKNKTTCTLHEFVFRTSTPARVDFVCNCFGYVKLRREEPARWMCDKLPVFLWVLGCVEIQNACVDFRDQTGIAPLEFGRRRGVCHATGTLCTYSCPQSANRGPSWPRATSASEWVGTHARVLHW
jgi:hypothetical protein